MESHISAAVLKAATKGLLEADSEYWKAVQYIKAQISQSDVAPEDVESLNSELLVAEGGANLIRNKAFGLSKGLLQPLQPLPANVVQSPASATVCFSTLPAGLDAWQRFIISRLHHLRAKAGVPLAGKQRDLQQNRRKVAKEELKASQRIGLARTVPVEPPAPPTPAQMLWRPSSPDPANPPSGSPALYLFRAKDLYEPLRQLLISPPIRGASMEAAMKSLNGSFLGISKARPASGKSVDGGPDKQAGEGSNGSPDGLHRRTLAEDLGLGWQDLQDRFQSLAPHVRQVGVDDELDPLYKQERCEEGEALLAGGSIPAIKAFLCTGAPGHLRLRLWMAALGHTSSHIAGPQARFEALCQQVELRPLFADLLVEDDISMISDQEQFFVFEETVRTVLLAFSRDPHLVGACQERPFPSVTGMGRHGQTHGAYPPSGVLPFRGMAFWIAPLCYLSQDPGVVYSLAVSLFDRHWSRLLSFVPSLQPASLPCLAAIFHLLVHEVEPEVTRHIESLGITPLQLVLPWMVNAFVDQLPVEQVLLLWDRIIAHDSLLPLAILALAVFVFRREVLLAAQSATEVVETMRDMSYMKVVPLLQAIIFSR
ncbi:hypothetical protein WJX84_010388 [Apatococcus fuscideae]|uniref:Rab-GAP TBC domain-containing protein n=1 Tax=Apatococcus fuscideae TaxID=2026836 RepID=A0AAW1T043_9CHLO